MLRDLEFRGSNSVCGRAIQRVHNPDQDLTLDIHSPTKPKALPSQKKLGRREVQVLDLADSQRVGADVFIQFKHRLHPWTTIRVSASSPPRLPTPAILKRLLLGHLFPI